MPAEVRRTVLHAPGASAIPEGEEADEDEGGPSQREVKPRFDLPLKGGLGDRDPNPFSMPPK
jgi:hypothetical protein